MDKTSIGDRFKRYEKVTDSFLINKLPIIIRIDGKAFHTLTKTLKLDKPFDTSFMVAMTSTARNLVNYIDGAKFAYTQSDEISILVHDLDSIETQPWYGNRVQKLVSVSASMATAYFNKCFDSVLKGRLALFDSRVFNLPLHEVVNYFIWRQQDATRNSISAYAHANFSHNSLHGKNSSQMQDLLWLEKGINWNNEPIWMKRGVCVTKNENDRVPPIFTQYRYYIEKHLGEHYEQLHKNAEG